MHLSGGILVWYNATEREIGIADQNIRHKILPPRSSVACELMRGSAKRMTMRMGDSSGVVQGVRGGVFL